MWWAKCRTLRCNGRRGKEAENKPVREVGEEPGKVNAEDSDGELFPLG